MPGRWKAVLARRASNQDGSGPEGTGHNSDADAAALLALGQVVASEQQRQPGFGLAAMGNLVEQAQLHKAALISSRQAAAEMVKLLNMPAAARKGATFRALLDLARLLEVPGRQDTTPSSTTTTTSSTSSSSSMGGRAVQCGLWQYAGPHLQLASLAPGTVVQSGGGDPPAALWLLQGTVVEASTSPAAAGAGPPAMQTLSMLKGAPPASSKSSRPPLSCLTPGLLAARFTASRQQHSHGQQSQQQPQQEWSDSEPSPASPPLVVAGSQPAVCALLPLSVLEAALGRCGSPDWGPGQLLPLLVTARAERGPGLLQGLAGCLSLLPLFRELGPDLLPGAAAAAEHLALPAGSVLYEAGDKLDWVYVLLVGRLALHGPLDTPGAATAVTSSSASSSSSSSKPHGQHQHHASGQPASEGGREGHGSHHVSHGATSRGCAVVGHPAASGGQAQGSPGGAPGTVAAPGDALVTLEDAVSSKERRRPKGATCITDCEFVVIAKADLSTLWLKHTSAALEQRSTLLRAHPAFTSMPPEAFSRVAEAAVDMHLPKGARLVSGSSRKSGEGDPTSSAAAMAFSSSLYHSSGGACMSGPNSCSSGVGAAGGSGATAAGKDQLRQPGWGVIAAGNCEVLATLQSKGYSNCSAAAAAAGTGPAAGGGVRLPVGQLGELEAAAAAAQAAAARRTTGGYGGGELWEGGPAIGSSSNDALVSKQRGRMRHLQQQEGPARRSSTAGGGKTCGGAAAGAGGGQGAGYGQQVVLAQLGPGDLVCAGVLRDLECRQAVVAASSCLHLVWLPKEVVGGAHSEGGAAEEGDSLVGRLQAAADALQGRLQQRCREAAGALSCLGASGTAGRLQQGPSYGTSGLLPPNLLLVTPAEQAAAEAAAAATAAELAKRSASPVYKGAGQHSSSSAAHAAGEGGSCPWYPAGGGGSGGGNAAMPLAAAVRKAMAAVPAALVACHEQLPAAGEAGAAKRVTHDSVPLAHYQQQQQQQQQHRLNDSLSRRFTAEPAVTTTTTGSDSRSPSPGPKGGLRTTKEVLLQEQVRSSSPTGASRRSSNMEQVTGTHSSSSPLHRAALGVAAAARPGGSAARGLPHVQVPCSASSSRSSSCLNSPVAGGGQQGHGSGASSSGTSPGPLSPLRFSGDFSTAQAALDRNWDALAVDCLAGAGGSPTGHQKAPGSPGVCDGTKGVLPAGLGMFPPRASNNMRARTHQRLQSAAQGSTGGTSTTKMAAAALAAAAAAAAADAAEGLMSEDSARLGAAGLRVTAGGRLLPEQSNSRRPSMSAVTHAGAVAAVGRGELAEMDGAGSRCADVPEEGEEEAPGGRRRTQQVPWAVGSLSSLVEQVVPAAAACRVSVELPGSHDAAGPSEHASSPPAPATSSSTAAVSPGSTSKQLLPRAAIPADLRPQLLLQRSGAPGLAPLVGGREVAVFSVVGQAASGGSLQLDAVSQDHGRVGAGAGAGAIPPAGSSGAVGGKAGAEMEAAAEAAQRAAAAAAVLLLSSPRVLVVPGNANSSSSNNSRRTTQSPTAKSPTHMARGSVPGRLGSAPVSPSRPSMLGSCGSGMLDSIAMYQQQVSPQQQQQQHALKCASPVPALPDLTGLKQQQKQRAQQDLLRAARQSWLDAKQYPAATIGMEQAWPDSNDPAAAQEPAVLPPGVSPTALAHPLWAVGTPRLEVVEAPEPEAEAEPPAAPSACSPVHEEGAQAKSCGDAGAAVHGRRSTVGALRRQSAAAAAGPQQQQQQQQPSGWGLDRRPEPTGPLDVDGSAPELDGRKLSAPTLTDIEYIMGRWHQRWQVEGSPRRR